MTTRRRRARTDAEKGERRMDILGAALELFESAPSALATVAAVAERAGLAKGTVYLYFTSREAIYLALLEDQLHAWLARFEDALPPMGEPMPTNEPHTAPPADATAEAATAFCAYPLTHRSMLRLASLANALLERNIEAAAALRFRRGFLQRMTTLGSRLDALWNLAPGTGRELLHQGYALLLGLWQLEEPAPVILEVMSGDEIETFGADFERRAVAAVRSLWRGAVASSTVP